MEPSKPQRPAYRRICMDPNQPAASGPVRGRPRPTRARRGMRLLITSSGHWPLSGSTSTPYAQHPRTVHRNRLNPIPTAAPLDSNAGTSAVSCLQGRLRSGEVGRSQLCGREMYKEKRISPHPNQRNKISCSERKRERERENNNSIDELRHTQVKTERESSSQLRPHQCAT